MISTCSCFDLWWQMRRFIGPPAVDWTVYMLIITWMQNRYTFRTSWEYMFIQNQKKWRRVSLMGQSLLHPQSQWILEPFITTNCLLVSGKVSDELAVDDMFSRWLQGYSLWQNRHLVNSPGFKMIFIFENVSEGTPEESSRECNER